MHRRHRLKQAADFRLLHRHGKRWHHPLAILIIRPNDQSTSRFGFSAGQRIGSAVKRNRAKRLLREVVRHRLMEITPGWDCLFIARKGAANADLVDVEAAVIDLLGRADLLSDKDNT